MAKRVTKTTLQRVKARKAAKKIDPPIVLEINEEAFIGKSKDQIAREEEAVWSENFVADQWPQNGKPNWGLIGVGLFSFAFWALVTWFYFG